MTIRLHPDAATARHVAEVAMGRSEADLVLAGGALVNVFSEEVQEGWGLALAGDRIAFAGPDAEVSARAGSATEQVNLGGDLVAPGLVEGHTHVTRTRISDMMDLQV